MLHDGYTCPQCGHRWRPDALPPDYYRDRKHRNPELGADEERKIADRLRTLSPLLEDGLRVLEIGCAEGRLGQAVKALARVDYTGLEISEDAVPAAERLDAVERGPAGGFPATPFDRLLAFHVLEHIADVGREITHWLRLLKSDGIMVIEVPSGTGHPLLARDRNLEHLHFFSGVSLTALLRRYGLETIILTTGHFESPVYPDSLRVVARRRTSDEARSAGLLARFNQILGGRFVVYGAGGDFSNYVAPCLDLLPVTAICDSDAALHGRPAGRHRICAYDPVAFVGLPVLIASLRYADEIRHRLIALGVPASSLHGLDEVYARQGEAV